MDARRTIRRWLPPAILDGIRAMRSPTSPAEWEYRPQGWNHTGDLRGWNAPAVSEAQRANWKSYKAAVEGTGPLGIVHTDEEPNGENIRMHNTVLAFAYALSLAGAGRPAVSLLDWGGGVGHYYPLARAVLPDVEIHYTCLDVPTLCEAGRELNPGAEFLSQSEALAGRRFDLVLSSGSMHYAEDWRTALSMLAGFTDKYFLLTRLPVVWNVPSFVVVQRPHWVYDTEYQGWFLNRGDLLDASLRSRLQLVRELALDEAPFVRGAPEQCQYRGFLFRPQPE